MGVLSIYITTPEKDNYSTFKRVLRYLNGRSDHVICYNEGTMDDIETILLGFFNANWDSDFDRIWLTGEYLFKLFSRAINWMNKKQLVVALSTMEFEYTVSNYVSKEEC